MTSMPQGSMIFFCITLMKSQFNGNKGLSKTCNIKMTSFIDDP
jgi:hypothetical protein